MYKSIHSHQYALLLSLLRETRRAAGLTQTQLAQRLEWSQADISKVESGVRRLDVIELRTWLVSLGHEMPAFIEQLERRLGVPATQLSVAARQGKKPRRRAAAPMQERDEDNPG